MSSTKNLVIQMTQDVGKPSFIKYIRQNNIMKLDCKITFLMPCNLTK